MNITMRKTALPFFAVFFFVALATFFVIALGHAQTTATSTTPTTSGTGITFPIPELGNCADKAACQAYCADASHIDACTAFAQAHGLVNKDEADRAHKFAQSLEGNGGPGGCKTPEACRAFCSDIANIDACTAFAKAHGVNDDNVKKADRVRAFLKSGGTMPGGCTSEDTCKAYCADFSHAAECAAFGKKLGIGGSGPASSILQKFADAVAQGQTPGGCKTESECQTYCKDPAHRDECVAFGVKVGFIKQEEADHIKQTGGTGPGGCNSSESCHAYCNDPAHRDECYKFGEDRGFIKPEEAQQAQQGLVQLRTGIEQAPPEVGACITSTLGSNTVDTIQSGTLTPTPEVGARIKDCFEKFGRKSDPRASMLKAPKEVIVCVKDKVGTLFDDVQSGKTQPTPELADAFRVCFQTMQLNQGGGFGGNGNSSPGVPPRGFQDFLKSAPPEVSSCLRDKLGTSFDQIESGAPPPPGATSQIRDCFNSFRPKEQGEFRGNDSSTGSTGSPQAGPMMGGHNLPRPGIPNFDAMPPQAQDCVKNVLGDKFDAIKNGTISPDQIPTDSLRGCFQRPGVGGGASGIGTSSMPQSGGQGGRFVLPLGILNCVKSNVSDDAFQKLQSGSEPAGDVRAALEQCAQSMRQGGQGASSTPQGFYPGVPGINMPMMRGSGTPQEFRPGETPQGFPSGGIPQGTMPRPGLFPQGGEGSFDQPPQGGFMQPGQQFPGGQLPPNAPSGAPGVGIPPAGTVPTPPSSALPSALNFMGQVLSPILNFLLH